MTNEAKRWNAWRIAGWGLAATLLMLPAVAMQFTDEVDWTGSDFAFAAALIGGTGLLLESVMKRGRMATYRVAATLAILTALALIWIDAAVQIAGDGDQPTNLVYPALVAIALVVAVACRGRAQTLARVVMSLSLALIAVAPIAVHVAGDQPPGAVGLVVFHGVFAALFALAAMLFGIDGRREVAGRRTPA